MKIQFLSIFFAALILGYFADTLNASTTPDLTQFEYPDFVFQDNGTTAAPAIAGKPTIAYLKAKNFNQFIQITYDNWPQYLYPIFMTNVFGIIGLYWLFAAGIIASMFFFCYPFNLKELKKVNKEMPMNKENASIFVAPKKKKGSNGNMKEGARQKK